MNTDSLHYAGFWPRLASLLLDIIIMLPFMALMFWGDSQYRLFQLYSFVPGILFGLFYSVYLVRRFGGTPGKLMVGIRIRKVDGEQVGYREAFLRYLPEFILGTLISIAFILSICNISDTEYYSLAFMERSKRLHELLPAWYRPVYWIQNAWFWGELIVLLTNRKKRALHDFIAGTIVVHSSPNKSTQPTAATSSDLTGK
jgi:uncharacterized RDD family membrane protein YckC